MNKEVLNKINKIELSITIISLLVMVSLPPLGVLIAFGLVSLYLLIGKERTHKLKSVGFRSPKNWFKTVLVCLFLGIFIEMSFQILINPIIEKTTTSKIDLTAYNSIRGNLLPFFQMLVIGWVVGGFIEEILFRGFLITRISNIFISERAGNWFAIFVTSTIFGLSHLYQGWSGVISTSLIAVFFGIIFIKNKRILWYSILTHGFVNVTGLTLMFLNYDKVISTLILK